LFIHVNHKQHILYLLQLWGSLSLCHLKSTISVRFSSISNLLIVPFFLSINYFYYYFDVFIHLYLMGCFYCLWIDGNFATLIFRFWKIMLLLLLQSRWFLKLLFCFLLFIIIMNEWTLFLPHLEFIYISVHFGVLFLCFKRVSL
jgi:hypothetical protein